MSMRIGILYICDTGCGATLFVPSPQAKEKGSKLDIFANEGWHVQALGQYGTVHICPACKPDYLESIKSQVPIRGIDYD